MDGGYNVGLGLDTDRIEEGLVLILEDDGPRGVLVGTGPDRIFLGSAPAEHDWTGLAEEFQGLLVRRDAAPSMAALPQRDLPPEVVVRELQVRRARTIDLGADSVGFVNAITEVARSDSLLFVLDGMAQTISVYQESNGAFVRSFGGQGRGPGEFEDPMALAVFDDTVYVVDPTFGPRVSVFKHDGTFIELRDLEVVGNPTDIVADAAGLVVITPPMPEQQSGQRHIAHRLTHGGEWLSSSCSRDGRFAISAAEGGLLARMPFSFLTATTDAISCTQPISPTFQVIEGEVPGLSYAPPFYRAPEDRPLAGVTQSVMFAFLSTWTSHGEAYVWRDRFLSVYSSYDEELASVVYHVFTCVLDRGRVQECGAVEGLGRIVDAPSRDTIYVEEISDAAAPTVIAVLSIEW
ncbi:6-bladed beta-propeller [Candidatus Palauibacter sp.]|uniref:6-bladed beta-propeller n=1 Tax=Candidatus Palauibacter sp. TaxID=3101350 RepID=UPI003B02725E